MMANFDYYNNYKIKYNYNNINTNFLTNEYCVGVSDTNY